MDSESEKSGIHVEQNEVSFLISTNSTTDDSVSNDSFSLIETIQQELFESDCWEDYLSEDEPENFRGNTLLCPNTRKKRVWNDNLERSCGKCNYIENSEEYSKMIKCEGYCRRPYHLKCTELNGIPDTRWKCSNCLNNLVFCNLCNSFGTKSHLKFTKCYHPLCSRFFHIKCILSHNIYHRNLIWTFNSNLYGQILPPKTKSCMHSDVHVGGEILKTILGKENIGEREKSVEEVLVRSGFKFICNRHYCSVCSDFNDKEIEKKRLLIKFDNPDELFYCIKCNTAYHENCLHPDSIKLIQGACICYKHIHNQTELKFEKYDLKKEIHEEIFQRFAGNTKQRNKGIKIDRKIRLELLGKIAQYISSSGFEPTMFPFELPGQSKDWLFTDLKDLLNKNAPNLQTKNPYLSHSDLGFINIKRNVYIEEENEYEGDFSENDENSQINTNRSFGLDSRDTKKNKKANLKKSSKKKSNLVKKFQISNERCSCKSICERDSCQNAAMYIECDSNTCGLNEEIQKRNCMNRIFNSTCNKYINNQKKNIFKNLKVVDTGEKGLGVVTLMNIPKDTFIIEYVGEVLERKCYLKRVEEYKQRELDSRRKSHLINGDYDQTTCYESEISENLKERHWYCMEIENDYIIDSTKKGNISRLINHSCDPNCIAQKWIVRNECRVGIFSKRDISPGEELTYDYSFTAFDVGFKCKCNTPLCKGRIGIENFKESNRELINKRNALCSKSNNMLSSFSSLNKSLLTNPLLSEAQLDESSKVDLNSDFETFHSKAKEFCGNLKGLNNLLHDHLINQIQVNQFDFKFRNSLYGYATLLYFDSPNIFSDWYSKKAKSLTLMSKPWILLPFVFNGGELTVLNYSVNLHHLKKYIFKRISILIERLLPNLNSNSLLWYLFDNGIGGDECCNLCGNPGTLITCDYCYDSFHRYCLYNNEIPNHLKRSRLSYDYNKKTKERVQCKNCLENELISVYWLQTSHKKRKVNYLLKQKVYSLPLFINEIGKF
ncbi:Histone-lysine N-methyltransferase [Cryptosporidium felis]|nr:Histone-lysine N-methyltransferase [Cryptosporidium felis]